MTETAGRRRFFFGWALVGGSFVMLALILGAVYSFPAFYLQMLEEFGWSRAATSGVFSASLLVGAAAYPLAGPLVDRFGPKLSIAVGSILLGVGFALSGFIGSLWQFYLLFGGVVAAGAPFVQVAVAVTLTNWFVRRRGTALGLAYSGIGAGIFALLPFSQYLISTVGWRLAYALQGALMLLVVLPLGVILFRSTPQEMGFNPDGGLAPGDAAPAPPAAGMTLHTAIAGHAFWLLLVGNVLVGIIDEAVYQHLVPHAVAIGYSKMLATWVLGLASAVYLAGQVAGGSLSDRLGRERVITLAAVLAASGIAIALRSEGLGAGSLYGAAVVYGLGLGATIATRSAVWGDIYQGRSFGTITGLLTLGYSAGGAFIAWFGGRMYDLTGSYSVTFTLAIASALVWGASIWVVAPGRLRSTRPLPPGAAPERPEHA